MKTDTIIPAGKVEKGAVHAMPADLRSALLASPKAKAVWLSTTPLAHNEWICWVTSGKKQETRSIRIQKAISKLSGGMRRPCCWVGCIHRKDKPMSAAQKFALSKRPSKKARK